MADDTGSDDITDLLTVKEAQEVLGVSRQTLYRLLERDELVSLMVGGTRRFTRASVEAYIRRQIARDREARRSDRGERGDNL